VTFASAWALAGLVLLVPLVILHLRDRGRPVRVVPSLVIWRELDVTVSGGDRGLRLPRLPLLLLLQAAAVIFLVFALAQPQGTAAPLVPAQVIVLDDSLWMSAPGRLADAKRAVARIAATAPGGAPIRVVLADGSPATLYRGGASGVRAALAHVMPSAAPTDLAGALTIAAGLLGGPRDRVTVIRAPEDALPPTSVEPGELRDVTIGSRAADQGLFDASARCGIGAPGVCGVSATISNGGASPVVDHYSAQVGGLPGLTGKVALSGGAHAEVVLSAVPDEVVSLRLTHADALPFDNTAWVAVPGAGNLPSSSVVTLVGTRARSLALARALVSVPGVTVRLRTPATYSPGDVRTSGLVVLDGWVPAGGLPPAPAVLLIDPPRLPGGGVGGAIANTLVSGTAAASPLLEGVDLGSLDIDPGAARRFALPGWMAPVAWSPGGPLLAAGDNGRQRVAVLAFEPPRSNLPALAAFPLLIANVVRWASGWAPPASIAGVPLLVDATPGARTATMTRGGSVVERAVLAGAPVSLTAPAPGLYTIVESGPGVRRQAVLAVSAGSAPAAAATPVDLRAARSGPRLGSPPSLEAWFLAAALVMMVLELLYLTVRRVQAVV
jgi:hypothetical protein